MFKDTRGCVLTTNNHQAYEIFLKGLEKYLSLDETGIPEFEQSILYDNEFSIAYVLLARQYSINGELNLSKKHLNSSKKYMANTSKREKGVINAIELMMNDQEESIIYMLEHLDQYPTDVIVLSQLLGPFGLLAFSNRSDWREENLKLILDLSKHFSSDDWWFETTKAFIYGENNDEKKSRYFGERSWELSANGNSAHTMSHIHYDFGSVKEGRDFIDAWLVSNKSKSRMEHHLRWHDALLALKEGQLNEIKAIYTDFLCEDFKTSPLEYLADNASLLWYCLINKIDIPLSRYSELYEFSKKHYPEFGFKFADMHKLMMASIVDSRNYIEIKNKINNVYSDDDSCKKLFEALVLFKDGEFKESQKILSNVIKNEASFGGSNVQRSILYETLEKSKINQ